MVTPLEQRIQEFEALLDEMKLATQEAHRVLRDYRAAQREIDRLMKGDAVKKLVKERVDKVVQTELDHIGPELQRLSHGVYDKVQKEADKLVELCLGKEFMRGLKGKGVTVDDSFEDLRPMLALKLKAWIREVFEQTGEPMVLIYRPQNGEPDA